MIASTSKYPQRTNFNKNEDPHQIEDPHFEDKDKETHRLSPWIDSAQERGGGDKITGVGKDLYRINCSKGLHQQLYRHLHQNPPSTEQIAIRKHLHNNPQPRTSNWLPYKELYTKTNEHLHRNTTLDGPAQADTPRQRELSSRGTNTNGLS